jgi:hypothetical protein
MLGILSAKPAAASPNGVAPLYASTTACPLSVLVFIKLFQTFYLDAKNRNALAVSAGFKIFIPVPQKLLYL